MLFQFFSEVEFEVDCSGVHLCDASFCGVNLCRVNLLVHLNPNPGTLKPTHWAGGFQEDECDLLLHTKAYSAPSVQPYSLPLGQTLLSTLTYLRETVKKCLCGNENCYTFGSHW